MRELRTKLGAETSHPFLNGVFSKKWFQDKYGLGKISTIYSPSMTKTPKHWEKNPFRLSNSKAEIREYIAEYHERGKKKPSLKIRRKFIN